MPLRLLTPRQASKLLGVSESTIRRWCDSGQLEGSKTRGGHRRIEVNALLGFAREQGLSVVTMGPASTAGRGGRLPVGEELALRYRETVASIGVDGGATEFAHQLIGELGEVETLCDEVMAPVLQSIGTEWSAGALQIRKEHIATQESYSALLASHSHFPPKEGNGVAVCAGLSGDPYMIAPAMCSLALRSVGMRTVLLGANSPAEEIMLAAKEHGAALIAISISVEPDDVAALAKLCEQANAEDIRVILGGRGLSVELRKKLNPDFFGDSMAHLIGYARRLPRQRSLTTSESLDTL